jgi:DNA-binding IscR family transcriptional regulator
MSVSAIASEAGASLQNISQHLRLMRDRGILNSRRHGHTIVDRVVKND